MLTLRTTKGSELNWVELDQNFTYLETLINDAQVASLATVKTSTDQSIDGIKTFTSSPVVPTPAAGDKSTKVSTTEWVKLNAAPMDTNWNIQINSDIDNPNALIGDGNANCYINGISNELFAGNGCIVTGSDNLIYGADNTWVSGQDNRVSGYQNIVKGKNNIAGGIDPANNDPSTQIITRSNGVILIGESNKNNGKANFSLGIGEHNINDENHKSSFLFGTGLISTRANSTWFGKYNVINTNAVFGIGSGTVNETRATLLEILSDGQIIVPLLAYTSITNAKSFVNKEYVDTTRQATLVSGSNIKTVNGNSLLGTGNLALTYTKTDVGLGNVDNTTDLAKPISTLTQTALNAKQATLVSGTNIKTVNGVSLLGSGDIVIGAGGTGTVVYDTYSTVGRIASYTALPTGYLLCNGQAVSRTTYSTLFAAIGTTYGAGDGSTTFNLPNLTEPTGVVVNTSADLLTSFGPIDYKTTLFMAFSGTRLVILATCGSRAHEITGLTLTPAAEYISYQSPTSINFEICQSGDGSILYIGDGFRNSTGANVMLVNDDGSQSLWSTIDDYIASCSKFKVCYLPNYSSYFVCGGYNWTPSNKTKLITSSVGVTVGEDLPVGLYNHTVTTLADGRVLITGGISSTGSSNGTYILTFTSATVFTVIVSNILPIDLFSHTATLLPDGKVLIIGGSSINDLTGYSDNAYILTITGDTISYSDPIMMPFAVMGHSAILTEFGRVIVAGGMLAGGTINLNYMMLSVTNTNKYIKY